MIPSLDILGDIATIIAGFFIIAAIIAAVFGYAIYRVASGLSATERGLLIAGLVIIGVLLLGSVVGSSIGLVSLLTGVFAEIFQVAYRRSEAES